MTAVDWRAVTVEWNGSASTAPLTGGRVACGPWTIEVTASGGTVDWSIANSSDQRLGLDTVRLDGVTAVPATVTRALSLGWQSWSPTGVVRVGVDPDPACGDGGIDFVRAVYHADHRTPRPGWNRSEGVTVIDGAEPLLVGAVGASEHDTTVWLHRDGMALHVQPAAWFGGAVVEPGERRPLHALVARTGTSARSLLASWGDDVRARTRARVGGPFLAGWCSWYHWFHTVTEADVLTNLAAADSWPIDVVQVDDGYAARFGDWVPTNERFPSGLDELATRITAAGRTPGLWYAPFLAHPESAPGGRSSWFARDAAGQRLFGTMNERWGGAVHVLDPTNAEVVDHLERVAAELTGMGWRYLKLDFTYGAALPGTFADDRATPAQRVRRGYDAVRRGAGDAAFLLACGAPLGPVVGVADAARIGEDVTIPRFPRPVDALAPGYARAAPVMTAPWRSLTAWAPMHRRLFQNDPDCVVLRPRPGQFTRAQVEAWARRVAASGGLVLASDDLPAVGAAAARLFAEVVDEARRVDADAAGGGCPPLEPFDTEVPASLR